MPDMMKGIHQPMRSHKSNIKKMLSDPSFMNQIREKFEITLKLDEDNMYYIIALLDGVSVSPKCKLSS